MLITKDILVEHQALIGRDNEFQREARLRQALWREARGLPIGLHKGKPLGSRLAMPFAQDTLANYFTENIKNVVRAEVQKKEKLYWEPRVYDDLLSSQPLCFNLFGELQHDLDLATAVFQHLLGEQVRVTGIEFEHSPGRGERRFTHDGSALDVFVQYDFDGGVGFVGIEVKYVEDLERDEAQYRKRYDEVTRQMGIFEPSALSQLRVRPLEQFWRDHLLVGSMLLDRESGFERGMFAVLYPKGNTVIESAVTKYRSCLLDASTFTSWTLEQVLDAVVHAGAAGWATQVRERYLGSRPPGSKPLRCTWLEPEIVVKEPNETNR